MWCLGSHIFLPVTISCPVIFFWISLMVWNLFSFGKSQKLAGHQIWAIGGQVTWVIQCFAKKLCTRCDAWGGMLSWQSCQSPGAHSCSLLNHLNSFQRGMFKLNTKSDADSLLYLLSHFECDYHTVHMLTQWCLPPPLTSTVKSSLFTHAHSRPLSLAAMLHRCCTKLFSLR